MANYRQAPKLIHVGNKVSLNKNVLIIPQDIAIIICSTLSGKNGNALKLLMFFIGTIGDGSFKISESWIMKSTGMMKTSYINARKTLCDLGWIELEKGSIKLNFNEIRKCKVSMSDEPEELGTSDNTPINNGGHIIEIEVTSNDNRVHDTEELGSHDVSHNKDIINNNKDIIIEEEPTQEINTDIKISRTGELEYILKRHNITEEDVKTIIRNNNIDDVTDFICFFHYMTKRDDCIASNSVPEIKNILSAYFECNKIKDIRSGYELYKEDIIEYASDEQKTIFTTSSFFHQFSSSTTLDDRKIESLQKLLSRGARLGTSFFKRNLGRPVAG